ncbi:GGDEF domain-containing protein [Aerococcus viridans]|uniref:GGDEF domain-containing protein n=1 Tax=Aerococcus urinaeequi TaxID=51665 RepID=UPI003AABD71B
MTGILNAVTTRRIILRQISLADYDKNHALLLLDGDKFKYINDRYGHLIGDQVIVNIAKALKMTYKETSVIGRVGGDEFVVFIEDVPSKEFIISKNGEFKYQLAKLNPEFSIGVSIGLAWLEEGDTYEALFMRADRAMYRKK